MLIKRRRFLRNLIWVPAAPAILRAGIGTLTLRDPASAGLHGPAGGGSSYTAYAVGFDGSTTYLANGADFTDDADSKLGTLSVWFKVLGGDGAVKIIFQNDLNFIQIAKLVANTIQVYGKNGTDVRVKMATTATYAAGSGWHHFLACWDTGTVGARHIYVDGIEDTSVTTFADGTIDYTRIDYAVGATPDGVAPFNGEMCELWWAPGAYINDASKFASGGKPISLGADGSLPGATPILYLKNPYSTWQENQGTGEGMSVYGALTEGTPP